MELLG